ncbi:aldehyde dehydrogenase family protein [Litoreibacter halocynthiae]|uniref:aldehyde dehydrogenase family protein n=1 Tax=Litoreibacter halocynthiae TaxID=1242689 RepID=UPI0024916E01|nr:aldehyde dehydrogenase family protein [Litoreibacter halocynthiae]
MTFAGEGTHGSALKTTNPITDKQIQSNPLMTGAQYAEAIKACHAAFEDWRHVPAKDRAATIKKIGKALRNHADKFASA